MAKKSFECPECGYKFEAEVDFTQDSDKMTLSGMGTGAVVGFLVGGPVGAWVGAAYGGKYLKRFSKTCVDAVRCPKCRHAFNT